MTTYYNLDIDPITYFSSNYYLDNIEDEADQKLSILFLDIEAYNTKWRENVSFNFFQAKQPISAITFFFNNKFYCYFLINTTFHYSFLLNLKNHGFAYYSKKFVNQLKEGYGEYEVEIKYFKDELTLITRCFEDLRKLDPLILSGFNADKFDYPYIFKRVHELKNTPYDSFNEEVNFVFSAYPRFVKLIKNFSQLSIPEFSICDLLHLYKPREDKGMNYGKKSPSYSLDYISDRHLTLKKVRYGNLNINEFYEVDPENYLYYNLIDVLLCVKLNEKLEFIALHNKIRRSLKNAFTQSIIKSNSSSFSSFVNYNLLKENKYVRCFATVEGFERIPKEKLNFPPMIFNKREYLPFDIEEQEYKKYVYRVAGAVVNTPIPKLTNNNSVIIDLDATSLYPSMMLQSNISFDSYKAYVLPSTLIPFIEKIVKPYCGSKKFPTYLYELIQEKCIKFTKSKMTSKKDKAIYYYYLICYFLHNLIHGNRAFNQLDSKSLRKYFFPLVLTLNNIHEKSQVYNEFIYKRVFYKTNDIEKVFILENPSDSNIKLLELNNIEANKYLDKYSVTLNGCCFYKHEDKLGLFTNFLQEYGAWRKRIQKEMLSLDPSSEEYRSKNSTQNSIKIIMNTSYGITALTGFIYSNTQISQAITIQGRLSIKLAQYIADDYLSKRYEN